jgi:protein TonB
LAKAALLTRRHRSPAVFGDRWLAGDRLFAAMLALSIVLHAVVLVLRFKPFDLDRFDRASPPLEVALVNAKSPSKPATADVLAQANLDGGGNTDAKRRARSPLPVMPKRQQAAEMAAAPLPQPQVPVEQPRPDRVEELERQARELLAQAKAAPKVAAEPKVAEESAPRAENPKTPTAGDILNRSTEVVRLEAQIARDYEAYQQRPKRRFIGARAEEYRFARYVEDWRMKIERVGNLNYPEAARQQKLYGSLLVTVSIRADGSVESAEINRTSGKRVLDAAVMKIVEMAAPFAPFPPDIRRDTDILHITRTWTFARGDSFTSE